jgi:cellulose synthase/poly-beta-1,6-N-acetylglucosamine synthase-like glycosyltransferase
MSKLVEIREDEAPLRSYPKVNILVPAYNEESCIADTLESLVEACYPNKEIIVVDDGSTDRTVKIAMQYASEGVKVFSKENGGKFSALNYGLALSDGDLIIIVDADSIIERRAIKELVKKFENPDVVAVCGNIKVLNRNNFLTKCQALEYIFSINIMKRALDTFGSITVVPGALGAFRKGTLTAGGSYDKDTLTEDFDTTLKVLKSGKVVQASSHASAYTEAPETMRDLYKQRMRWYRGNYQTISKHRDAFTNPGSAFSIDSVSHFSCLTCSCFRS